MNGETGQGRTALVENLKELHLPHRQDRKIRSHSTGRPKPCWRSPPHPAASPLPSWPNKCEG